MKSLRVIVAVALLGGLVQCASFRRLKVRSSSDSSDGDGGSQSMDSSSSSNSNGDSDSNEDGSDVGESSDGSESATVSSVSGPAMADTTSAASDGGAPASPDSVAAAVRNLGGADERMVDALPRQPPSGDIIGSSTTRAPESQTGVCFPGQTCTELNLLDYPSVDGQRVSDTYNAAFEIIDQNLASATILLLLDEANGEPASRTCGGVFSPVSATQLDVTLRNGPARVQFTFPAVQQGPSSSRTLSNAEVRYTLPAGGSFGDLQLRFSYDSTGALTSIRRFIQPPGQAQLIQFPVLQTVCTPNPAVCASAPATDPPQVQLNDPLPMALQVELFGQVLQPSVISRCEAPSG